MVETPKDDDSSKWPIWEVTWTVKFFQNIAAPNRQSALHWVSEPYSDKYVPISQTAKVIRPRQD